MKERWNENLGGAFEFLQSTLREKLARLDRFPYHNSNHVSAVVEGVEMIGMIAKLSVREIVLLKIAALYHEIGMLKDKSRHEEISAEFAQQDLKGYEFDENDIILAKRLILATKGEYVEGLFVTKPSDFFEQIICDADLRHLGEVGFPETSEQLRQELGVEDRKTWIRGQIKFLEGHHYYTPQARQLWDEQKAKNLEKLRSQVT